MVRVDGGYIILNYDKYRQRDYTAKERMRRYRENKKAKVEKGKKVGKSQAQVRREAAGREARFVKAELNGDQEGADRIAAEGLERFEKPGRMDQAPPPPPPPAVSVDEDSEAF